MPYTDYSIKITTTGNSNKIKLNGIYTYVSSKLRRDNVAKPHEYKIKRLCMGSVKDYYSMQTIYLDMMGHINGFILTKINPNMINKIYLRFDNRIRLHYKDKYEIMLNTIRINDDTLYINLNDNSYMADVNENSLNTSFFNGFINWSIGLDEEYQNNPCLDLLSKAGIVFLKNEGNKKHFATKSNLNELEQKIESLLKIAEKCGNVRDCEAKVLVERLVFQNFEEDKQRKKF